MYNYMYANFANVFSSFKVLTFCVGVVGAFFGVLLVFLAGELVISSRVSTDRLRLRGPLQMIVKDIKMVLIIEFNLTYENPKLGISSASSSGWE